MSRSIAIASEQLGHKLGRRPTVAELAEATGRSEEEVMEAQAAQRAYVAEPLTEPGAGGEREEDVRPGARTDGRGARIRRGVRPPPDLELAPAPAASASATSYGLRFYHDMTQAEIAAELGISQMHVSRLLRSALASLRAVMEAEQPVQAVS